MSPTRQARYQGLLLMFYVDSANTRCFVAVCNDLGLWFGLRHLSSTTGMMGTFNSHSRTWQNDYLWMHGGTVPMRKVLYSHSSVRLKNH